MNVNKALNLEQLRGELAAAGVTLGALGQTGADLHTYDANGVPAPLPGAAAVASVVAAHVAQPTDKQADMATVKTKAQGDPAFAALARLLGLV